jgi:N-acetylneuraminic acid mutarotase
LFAYTASSNTWTTKASMPGPGGCGAGGVLGGKLYVYSSFVPGVLHRFDRYDPATNTWATLPSPLSEHGHPAAAGVVNGKFYLAGGMSSAAPSATLESYDPATNAWAARAPMPTPRSGAVGVVINGLLYVIGGNSGGPPLNTMVVYTAGSNNTWRSVSLMPTNRTWLTAGAIKGVLYAAGGHNFQAAYLGTTEAYLP